MRAVNSLIVCQKELREVFRDRRAILHSHVIPIGWGPVLVFFSFLFGSQADPLTLLWFCNLFAFGPVFVNMPLGVSMTTGEKERSTIETTLAMCASREELVLGKYLAVVVSSLTSVALMIGSVYIARQVGDMVYPERPSVFRQPLFQKVVVCFFLYTFFYLAWFSAMTLVIGLFARNVREATGWLNALFMALCVLPALTLMIHLKMNLWTRFIPIMNVDLVCRQFLNSSVQWFDWTLLGCLTAVYTWIPVRVAARLMKDDAMLAPP